MKNRASAHWTGPIREGEGSISTARGALQNAPYGFNSRFGDGADTNPEELIGAAHAACFSMALSKELGERGIEKIEITTNCTVSLEEQGEGFAITRSHLDVKVAGQGDESAAREAVETAAANCPVSKLLSCEITHEASYSFV
ncbi:MAG: OsmC family peroxiredoxin [Parvularcula sp.]|jgi:osmotically inducible protein OsmC|nr:OsmC family peroxiredoxin [Parvularcula sp.]